MFDVTKGIAGTDVEAGQVLTQQIDGKFYRARAGDRPRGVTAEPVRQGQLIEADEHSNWRAV